MTDPESGDARHADEGDHSIDTDELRTRRQAYTSLDAVEEELDARDIDAAQEATERLQDRLDELEEYDDG